MTHVALLGDSVIDNGAYVAGGPDVAEQLRTISPGDWEVTSHARDGAVIDDVVLQFTRLPRNTTHIVISAGGNDALQASYLLTFSASSVGHALLQLGSIRDQFRRKYGAMLDKAITFKLPTAICTIYDPRFPEPDRRKINSIALTVLNDAITREAFARGIDLIDLRIVFDDDKDFANPIEPSVQGGNKLASKIVGFVSGSGAQAKVFR